MADGPQQTLATQGYHPRLAVAFDFDKTLAPDSLDELLRHVGVDPEPFHNERVKPLMKEGWDQILAQFYALVQASRNPNYPKITRDLLEEVGRNLKLYPGVPELFGRVREYAKAILDDIEVEFYIVTCGLIQMHRAHPIAKEFKGMWGSEFHFNEDGEIDFAKSMITFPEKIHYLLALSKGLDMRGPNEPDDAFKPVSPEKVHVPLSQMLYVGDGASDMPAFNLMNDHGGLALGVVYTDRVEDWPGYKQMRQERRVQNLAPADYSEGAELLESVKLAVESICKLIALRKLGEGE